MANTSITLEELRILYNKWRTAWRPAFMGLAGINNKSTFCVPKNYPYIKVISGWDPDSITYPYALNYDGLVDNMPNPLNICIEPTSGTVEHQIIKVNSPDPNFSCYIIQPVEYGEAQINNPLSVFIRMEEV